MHPSSSNTSKSISSSQQSSKHSPISQVNNVFSQNIINEEEVVMNDSYDVHNSSSMIVNFGSQPSDFEPSQYGLNGAMSKQTGMTQNQGTYRHPPQSPETVQEVSQIMMGQYVEGQGVGSWRNTDKCTPPRGQRIVTQPPQQQWQFPQFQNYLQQLRQFQQQQQQQTQWPRLLQPEYPQQQQQLQQPQFSLNSQYPLQPQQPEQPQQLQNTFGRPPQIQNIQMSQNPYDSQSSSANQTTILNFSGYYTPGFTNTSSKSSCCSSQIEDQVGMILSQGSQVNSSQTSQPSFFSFGMSDQFQSSSQQSSQSSQQSWQQSQLSSKSSQNSQNSQNSSFSFGKPSKNSFIASNQKML